MSADTFLQVTDRNLAELLAAPQAILILTKSTCGACAQYQAEIEACIARGQLNDIAIGKLVLDQHGSPRFKRDNPWLAGVQHLPYTVLYQAGQQIDAFAASKSAYLMERLEDAFAPTV